jgi:hypothetical protein
VESRVETLEGDVPNPTCQDVGRQSQSHRVQGNQTGAWSTCADATGTGAGTVTRQSQEAEVSSGRRLVPVYHESLYPAQSKAAAGRTATETEVSDLSPTVDSIQVHSE